MFPTSPGVGAILTCITRITNIGFKPQNLSWRVFLFCFSHSELVAFGSSFSFSPPGVGFGSISRSLAETRTQPELADVLHVLLCVSAGELTADLLIGFAVGARLPG